MQGLLDLQGEFHLGACDTEREAAELVTPRVPKQARTVLETIAGADGLAGWEICDRTGILRGSVSRSLTQLKGKGFIEAIGKRTDLMDAPARVWAVTDEGRSFLKQQVDELARLPVDGVCAPMGVKAQEPGSPFAGPHANGLRSSLPPEVPHDR